MPAQALQVGHHRVELGLALQLGRGLLDLGVGVGIAQLLQRAHAPGGDLAVHFVLRQPREAGHVGFRHHVARVDQVHALPVVGVAAADAGQVRASALAAPLERPVVDRLAYQRVVAVALGLEAQRAHHLRVAVVAALADVDVAAGQLKRRVGLDPFQRLDGLGLVHQRDDFGQAAEGHRHRNQHGHQADVLFDFLV